MQQFTAVISAMSFVIASSTGHACKECQGIDAYVSPDEIHADVYQMAGKRGGDKRKAVEIQKARGVIETGLVPDFIDGGDCPEIDSEKWAIDYNWKRGKAALHKGIDIPQPIGTPILAIADGTVVGKFENPGNRKGVEIMLRHTPEQTGLPYWTYSQYTHLEELPGLPIGTEVKMGDVIAKTLDIKFEVRPRELPATSAAERTGDRRTQSASRRILRTVDGKSA